MVLPVLAGYGLALHRLIPRRFHLVANLGATAAFLAVARAAGMSPAELGIDAQQIRRGTRPGLAASGLVAVTVGLLATSPRLRRQFADERVRAETGREIAYEALARIPIGTALFEELVFRGVLSGLLLRTMAPGAAYLTSATAFGLWHVGPTLRDHGGSPVAGRVSSRAAAVSAVLVTAPAGLLFEALRRRNDSLLPPVLAHAALNASAYLTAQAAHRELAGTGARDVTTGVR